MTLDSSSEGGLSTGLSGLVNAAVALKNAFDPEAAASPDNTGPAPRLAVSAAAAPWYQRPAVIIGAAVALVLGFLLWRRGK
jgi:hypothetical protein